MLGTCSLRPRMGATPFLRATGSSTTTLLPLGRYLAWSCRSLPTSLQGRLKMELSKAVCIGSVTLAEAQREIATDWRAAYKDWLDPKGCE